MRPMFLILLIMIGLCRQLTAQSNSLQRQIQAIVDRTEGTLGVAVIDLTSNSAPLTFNNHHHFPMQSVYKYHLGMAILHEVDKGKWTLDQSILVKKEDLLPNTHSPLRDKYPNGNVRLPLREILEYTIAQSDNNGCDILFRLIGGPAQVEKYMRSIGIKDIAIATTEEAMHLDSKAQFRNWSTPLASAQLLQKFYQKKLLKPRTHQFMWETLVSTVTGPHKLKGMLPKEAVVAHKTGWSGADKNGLTAATNDIGIFQLPNGKHVVVAVFLANTKAKEEDNDKAIAAVGKAVWEYYK